MPFNAEMQGPDVVQPVRQNQRWADCPACAERKSTAALESTSRRCCAAMQWTMTRRSAPWRYRSPLGKPIAGITPSLSKQGSASTASGKPRIGATSPSFVSSNPVQFEHRLASVRMRPGLGEPLLVSLDFATEPADAVALPADWRNTRPSGWRPTPS